MKTIFLTLITLSSFHLFGQVHSLGVQGGLNLTNQAGALFDDTQYRKGMIGGINYEYLFPNHFTLGADLLYSQQGFNDKALVLNSLDGLLSSELVLKYNYDYITLPVKLGYTQGEQVTRFIKVGICPSVLHRDDFDVEFFDENGNFNSNANPSKFDLSGLVEVGAGYLFQSQYEIFSSISYKHSITSFTNSQYFNNEPLRHYGFSLSVGLKYRFNTKVI